jgi:hypothetical protein
VFRNAGVIIDGAFSKASISRNEGMPPKPRLTVWSFRIFSKWSGVFALNRDWTKRLGGNF